MAYPILAPQNTWWAPTNSSITKASITEIEIMDSYTPDASVTVRGSWDASAAKDSSITCYVIGPKLIIAGNGSGKIAANENSSQLFYGSSSDYFFVTNFLSINLLDTSNVTNLSTAFGNCRKLLSLELSNWNTSQVTTMNLMFGACNNLSSINLSNLNISNVKDLSFMFYNCSNLTNINLSNWNTSKVTAMKQMFRGCTALTAVTGLANWNTSNVTDLSSLFNGCDNLISCDIENWNTANVTTVEGMFFSCDNLTSLNLSNWNTANIENMYDVFGYCYKLTTIGDLSNWSMSKVKYTAGLFNNCNELITLGDLSNWDMSNVVDMKHMFTGCNSLVSIGNISNWDVSNVTNMSMMFQDCSKLTGIGNLANWNTSNVTDMSFMFYSCSSLKEIDVSKWNVSKVQNFDHFAAHAGLRRKGIENWDTSSATNMNAMFHNCAEEELDLSGFKTDKVQFFTQMFENSPNLKHIKGLDKWNTNNATGFDQMFGRCPKLEELDLSSFDTKKAKNGIKASTNGHTTATLFNFCNDCQNLKWIKLGPNFAVNGDGTNTNAEYKLILPTPSTDYIEGADGNWYAFNGEPYAPNAIKDKTAETYFASYDLCANQNIIVKNGSMIEIAKAIREKNGSTEHYTPAQFGAAIRAMT